MKFFKKHWEVLSYLIFGVLTTLLNIVLYALFNRLFGYTAANSWGNVLDNVICILFAYVTNRAFVFASRTQGREALKEFGAFVTCRLGTLVLDAAIVMIFGNLLAAQGAALVESFMNGALSLLAGWFGPDTVLHMATGGAAPAPSISDGSAAIAIIGGADGPTAIFLSSKLAPNLMGAIAVSAYSYMALVPVIQPPIMRLLTTKNERVIRMKPPRAVSHTEKVIFPIIGLLLTCFLVPSGLPLLGMLFFGNLLKESGVTRRLANTASGPLIDTITILLGLTVGASTQASEFLTLDSIKIFALGALSFVIATASGVIFVKIFNIFLKKGNKINPLIGNAGVSAVPDSARISQVIGLEYDSTNYLLMHAMGPNVAGVIGSAVAAGILLGFLM